MKKIIISINPEHVKNIINGTKKFEYRTKAAKSDVNKIIIYEKNLKLKINVLFLKETILPPFV